MTDRAAPELAVQSVAYAGLDTLLLALPLELCAYLHVGEELGPQLYLRRPTLSALDPAEAFQLFSSLRDLLDAPELSDGPVVVGAFDAHVVRSTGPRSTGLWVIGSRGEPLGSDRVEVARAMGESVMALCHAAEGLIGDGPASPATPVVSRVAVETIEAGLRAEVVVAAAGRESTGHADAPSALAAVASATLDAVGSPRKLVAAEEDGLGDTRVVLVLTMDDVGGLSVGSALAEGGPLAAAAAAALESVARS